jgi:hypothetical protein
MKPNSQPNLAILEFFTKTIALYLLEKLPKIDQDWWQNLVIDKLTSVRLNIE